MKDDYKKIIKIQKYSQLVGCMKKFPVRSIELLLLLVHFVIIILFLMNLFIIPWKQLDKKLLGLRIVILSFLVISILCLIYNQIVRKRKKLIYGYYYCIAFYGTLISFILNILNFIFILISCIVIIDKIKKINEKTYDYKSILTIDIFSILIIFGMFFLWYTEFIIIYSKTDKNLKDFIEDKIQFYQNQNQKIVNVEISDEINHTQKNSEVNEKVKEKTVDEDIITSNKMEFNSEKHLNNKTREKDYEEFSVETK